MRFVFARALPLFFAVGLGACRMPVHAESAGGNGVAPAQPAAGVVAAAPKGGADWPRFRGPDYNGISREKGINKDWQARPPKLLWKQDLGDKGYGGPSVADGLLYITAHRGTEDVVLALNVQTGEEKWHYAVPDSDKESMGQGFTRTTPTVDGDRVYTLSRFGKLFCFESATGKVIWSKDIVETFHGQRPTWDIAGSPLVDGDKLIVCPGGPDASVVALNKMTGETIWSGGGSDVPGYSTPYLATIGGVRQYVCTYVNSVGGVATTDGKLLWKMPWVTGANVNAATPLVIGNRVFITSGYGHGCAMLEVQGDKVQPVWMNKEMQAHFSSPIFTGGHIYGTGDPGTLMCLDPQTGSALWKQKGFEKGGIIVIDGVIIGCNGSNGDVIMADLSPSGYKELGRITPLGGQSWTAPIVAEGKLIVRNNTAIACLDLK
jgi:outer membrane protein assembly factor BamB